MAVTYPLSLPATNFRTARFGLSANITRYESPFTRDAQRLERIGSLWIAEFALPALKQGADAAAWTAFFTSLRGSFGTFYGFDSLRRTPRGTAPGTPLVNGASQAGHSLVTDGWTAGQTGILLAGDYIEVGGFLYMVVEDADSDGGGNSTLEIEPTLRTSPSDGAAITTSNPKAVMRLVSDDIGWSEDQGKRYGFAFRAVEDI